MEYDITEFWDRIKKELEIKKITTKELAAQSDIPLQTLWNQMSKGQKPNIIQGIKMAQALNVSIEYLVTGKGVSEIRTDDKSNLLNDLKAVISKYDII